MKWTNSLPSLFIRIFAIMSVVIIAMPLFSAHAAQSTSEQRQQGIAEETISEAELAQILAPIALYPDSLLTHILIATTYPLELVQANRWVKKQKDVDVSSRMQLAEGQSWDPSVIALTAFPSVLEKLNDDLDWVQNLGDAFLQDEEAVLAMVQTLRRQADDANSFDNMDNMRVTKVEKQIIIEPAQPEVIYAPYYDTRVVYGNWYWHAYPPVYWYTRPVYAYHRPIYWGPSVYVNFNYFFGSVHWSQRRVVVINHRHSNYYQPSRKIAYSSGAKRWKHQPTHRHGVAYRSSSVSKRYDSPQRYQQHQQARSMRNNTQQAQSRTLNKETRLHNSQAAYKVDNSPQHRVNQSLQLAGKERQNYSNNKQTRDDIFTGNRSGYIDERQLKDRELNNKQLNDKQLNTKPNTTPGQHDRVSRELQRQKEPAQYKNNDRNTRTTTQVTRTQTNNADQQPAKASRELNNTRELSRQKPSNQSFNNQISSKPSHQVAQPPARQEINRQASSNRQADSSRQSSARTAPQRQPSHNTSGSKSREIER